MDTTNVTTPEVPLSGSLLADGGAEGDSSPLRPETNYPLAFGYAYQGMCMALSMLRWHQYERAIDQLARTVEGMERLKAGWDPEAER